MHSCYYLYQIAQELKNLEPDIIHDLLVALIPTIPSLIVSIKVSNTNRKLQERLHNSDKQEAMRLEYLKFREQVGLTRWHIERVHSSLSYLAASGEIGSVKTRLQEQIDTFILSAERYSFISKKTDIIKKTKEISLTIESLFPLIDELMDSDDAMLIQNRSFSSHDLRSLLDSKIKTPDKNSHISILHSKITDVINEFKKYEASDAIKPQE